MNKYVDIVNTMNKLIANQKVERRKRLKKHQNKQVSQPYTITKLTRGFSNEHSWIHKHSFKRTLMQLKAYFAKIVKVKKMKTPSLAKVEKSRRRKIPLWLIRCAKVCSQFYKQVSLVQKMIILASLLFLCSSAGIISGIAPYSLESNFPLLPEQTYTQKELSRLISFENTGKGGYGEFEDRNFPIEDILATYDYSEYIVPRGDTLWDIQTRHNISYETLIAVNGITNVYRLVAGEKIIIPNMDGILYKVKRGDHLESIAKAHNVSSYRLMDVNDLKSDVLKVGQNLFIPGAAMDRDTLRMALGTLYVWPTAAQRVTSSYGYRNDPFTGVRRFHHGVDIAGPVGTAIYAAREGRVADVGSSPIWGNYIVIRHSNRSTLYAHLHRVYVARGANVRQGQTIGEMGSTGYSTGPHLHFGILDLNGRSLNPMTYLR